MNAQALPTAALAFAGVAVAPSVEGPAPIEALGCFLAGGPSQRPATAVAHDVAQAHGASLTALAPVDPFVSDRPSRVRDFCRVVFTNVFHDVMRRSARRAIQDFERQNAERRIGARRIISGAARWSLRAAAAQQTLVVAPAWVGLDGVAATVENEAAAVLARRARIPVLRVASRPLDADKVLLLTDGASRPCRLARTFVKLGLWRKARIVILPVGGNGSSADSACEQRNVLRMHGRNAAVLPPLDGDAIADLETLARQFHVAAVDRRLARNRVFGSPGNRALRAVADRVPAILLL
jgi:hypothetical protein